MRSGKSSSGVCAEMSYTRRRTDALVSEPQMAFIRRVTLEGVQREAAPEYRNDSKEQSPIMIG